MSYFLLIIFGFLLFGFLGFFVNTHPPKIDVGNKPENFGLSVEDITLKTKDGLALSAWYIERQVKEDDGEVSHLGAQLLSEGAIIILHGYPAEKSDMLSFAKSLNSDFSILLLDMRYFGKSEGKQTTLGCKEKLDVVSAVDFLEEKGYEKIGVLGFSFGASVAMLAAEKDDRINAVASYSATADFLKLGRELYWFLPGVNYPLVWMMGFWAETFFGCDFKKDTPENAAGKLQIPIFISHSKEDEQIPFSRAELLRDALKDNKDAEFYFIERGSHGYLEEAFLSKVLTFFKSNL